MAVISLLVRFGVVKLFLHNSIISNGIWLWSQNYAFILWSLYLQFMMAGWGVPLMVGRLFPFVSLSCMESTWWYVVVVCARERRTRTENCQFFNMSSVTIMRQIHSCCTHLQSCTRWYQCLEIQNRKLLHLGNEHSQLHQFPCLNRREGMIHSQNSQQHPARSVQNQTQIPYKGRIDLGIRWHFDHTSG